MPLFNSQFNDKGVGVLAKSFTGTAFLIGAECQISNPPHSKVFSHKQGYHIRFSSKSHIINQQSAMFFVDIQQCVFLKSPHIDFTLRKLKSTLVCVAIGWYWPTGQNPLISLKKEVKRRSARIWLERPMILQVKARHQLFKQSSGHQVNC